jgi:hypothetical protein
MFENNIKFTASKEYINIIDKSLYPQPASKNIPGWFKKLGNNPEKQTAKHCMPFLDTLTTGYILKMPYDLQIKHNLENNQTKQKDAFQKTNQHMWIDTVMKYNINFPKTAQFHPQEQLEGSPLVEKNKNLSFHKIVNPWKIHTPKGYSCLFVSPLNNADDRFSVISGIVDTDTHDIEINFPFVVNGDKYPILETIIKTGTPYVQVIPFKREAWKMNVKSVNNMELIKNKFNFFLSIREFYKNNRWNKKIFK